MKTIPMPEDPDTLVDDETVGMLDWLDNPVTVLEEVDKLLALHGLEIVDFNTMADEYLFRIEKRVAGDV